MNNPKSLVLKKHSDAIQIKVNGLSTINRKALNLFILTMQIQETINQKKGLPPTDLYKVPLSLLHHVCGMRTKERTYLKDEILKIKQAEINLEHYEETDEKIIEIVDSYTLIPTIRIFRETNKHKRGTSRIEAQGNVWFEIHHKLKEKLFKPEYYTPINLITIKNFRVEYAVPLYENLLNWANAKPNKPFTLSIEELRERLGVGSKHKSFKHFRRWVLEKSIAEINEKSDLKVDYKINLRSQKAVSVTFELTHKKSKKVITIDDLAAKLMNGESIDQIVSEFVDGLVEARLGTPEEIKNPERYKGAVAIEILRNPENFDKVKKQTAKTKIKNEQAKKSNLTEEQEEKKRFSFFNRFLGK